MKCLVALACPRLVKPCCLARRLAVVSPPEICTTHLLLNATDWYSREDDSSIAHRVATVARIRELICTRSQKSNNQPRPRLCCSDLYRIAFRYIHKTRYSIYDAKAIQWLRKFRCAHFLKVCAIENPCKKNVQNLLSQFSANLHFQFSFFWCLRTKH